MAGDSAVVVILGLRFEAEETREVGEKTLFVDEIESEREWEWA